MLNSCFNHVVFKGEAEKIKKAKAFCQGMDFNKIVPMPESLGIDMSIFPQIAEKIFSGKELFDFEKHHLDELPLIGERSEGKPYGESSEDISYLWMGKKSEGAPEEEEFEKTDELKKPVSQGDLYEMGRLIKKNRKCFGAGNWLEWRYLHWGVKAPARNINSRNKGNVLEYDFETAQVPPVFIMLAIFRYLRKLSDPDIEVSWSYDVEHYYRGEYILTEAGVKETARYDYDICYKKPEIAGISFNLNVSPCEFAVPPDGSEDERGLYKEFTSKEKMAVYIEGLPLVNNDFKNRLLEYVREYDTDCEYIYYWSDEGLTDVEPVIYFFKISTVYKEEQKI